MLNREEVLHLCGDVPDWKIARIIASEANYAELETAVMWLQGADPGPDHRTLEGRVAYLYEVLTADEDIWGEEG